MTDKTRIAETRLGFIDGEIAKLAELLRHEPDAVRELDDRELLALDTWADGGDEIIRGECIRRAEQGRRFTAYLTQAAQLTHDDLKALEALIYNTTVGDTAGLQAMAEKIHAAMAATQS